MNTEGLLEKYFEGRTTSEEEKKLRSLFSHDKFVPEHLQVYRPLFAYLDEEVRRSGTVNPVKKTVARKKHMIYILGGVAAGVLMILGIAGMHRHLEKHFSNYVFIDGKQFTDIDLIRQQAQSALDKVRISKEEVFAVLFEEQ
ncbi:hypothetical protein EZS27_039648 [termite gut metagenome]|uniref:Uncharacterized protein n=1 Tax=termite gut metagenome TaxID=433724 RepID=A0A5J4PJK5_9ZZZZ